ncbi:response regulator transcription factor [Asticcacaulis sp. AC402]|uniref:response regulator transcription factor n=1 Tax=Asticcacaulis sp. AC402 TaxID=1282361 RepID=UPI0003C3BD4D|nr:response regulator transcription factor [Asticcacaulis sp. AC402]ESQ73446.1 hypothetical protein ABAC402_19255 [Asticcacaulis sp. AC402]
MSHDPIRILIVDDHMVVRAGLVQVIGTKPGMQIVGEAANGEDAIFLCQKLRPDIVVMDIRMRGMGGVAAIETLCKLYPETRVVALSTFDDPVTVERVMAAGGRGFLAKTLSAAELVDAVMRIHRGEIAIKVDGDGAPPEPEAAGNLEDHGLGSQQRRVLALLTKGYTNADIAAYMNLSVPTARYHVGAVLMKLGVANRAEAAAMAVRNRLIGDSDF